MIAFILSNENGKFKLFRVPRVTGVTRGPRGPCHQIFRISSHFVLWQAVSQTKYCCSPKIKHLGPSKIPPNFGLATPLLRVEGIATQIWGRNPHIADPWPS